MSELKTYKNVSFEELLDNFDMILYGRRIAVKERELEQVGSIIIANATDEARTKEGIVVAVGPDIIWDVKIGDKVYYGKFAGAFVTRNGEEFILMNDNDLIGKVKEGNDA